MLLINRTIHQILLNLCQRKKLMLTQRRFNNLGGKLLQRRFKEYLELTCYGKEFSRKQIIVSKEDAKRSLEKS